MGSNATADKKATCCGRELVVLETRLLSGSAHGCLSTYLKEGEEQKVLEAEDDEEKESEVHGEVEEKVTERAHETLP